MARKKILRQKVSVTSENVIETLGIGRKIDGYLEKGDIDCLAGQLGSGKTVLGKGFAHGLCISKNEVISPSFVLLRIHKGRHLLHHFDLYRLKAPHDILNLGYEEYFYSDGITIIEWPQRLKFLLPKEFLKIKLSNKSRNQRMLEFIARGPRYKQLLKRIYENIRN